MRSIKIVLVLVASCLCLVSTGLSQPKVYTIGVEELHYFPYYTYDSHGYNGFARELLDTFAKQKGITFKYKIEPVKRLFNSFLQQRVDFKFPDNPYWQSGMKKGHTVVYSHPIVEYIDGVMVLPQNKGAGLGHLKILGTVKGFTPWDYLDLIKAKTVSISENSSFPGLLKQTIKKRVDGAYINPVVARYHLENSLNSPNALVFDPDLPHTKSAYLLSTIKYPEIVAEMNQFLKEKKDIVDNLKNKYKLNL